MNEEDRKLFHEIKGDTKRLQVAIIGDPQMGLKGLVQRQDEDEENQKRILQELLNIKDNQQTIFSKLDHQSEQLNDHTDRIKILESFFKVWKRLGSIKKKTILIIGTLMATITSLIGFWEKIKSYIVDLFNN